MCILYINFFFVFTTKLQKIHVNKVKQQLKICIYIKKKPLNDDTFFYIYTYLI